ncbi:hypothetical protein CYLTODRAFT_342432 [Cylindrobasidium torrendii FP15055 ss-10]|uniref:Eukaryotic translation initiation factor SUI1 family protein n=1 Tax=Cylindrobasidium torrendii FP15055 ss-10 TaxID=1314674 RepID=A0A0D7BS31_9AGAR|nr:hypothetical protein CYLTODRAFT_342432 [Cylindrobasidium torrendii FP15055 ss-10]
MFKKPLSNLKSSSPLRSSDRRKLKQRVVTVYSLPAEDGDLVVPEGILTAKFITHTDLPGVVYLSSAGDPLWISLGKNSDELIPTLYTLWKKPTLLPFICTPSPVIPVLVGGADLMIPGVMFSSTLSEGQLVAVCQYEKKNGAHSMSAPLAVGRTSVSSDGMKDRNLKGKAAITIHTWKDHLWDMGSKQDVPEASPVGINVQDDSDDESPSKENLPEIAPQNETPVAATEPSQKDTAIYSKEDVSSLLRFALLQALSTAISPSAFPITLSTFYSTYVLPCRPAFPSQLIPCEGEGEPDPRDLTIKGSTHKSVTAFIKAAEKENLLTTKLPPKHSELLVTGVNTNHPSLQGHVGFVTLGALEAKAAKKVQNEEKRQQQEAVAQNELDVQELWKPHQSTVALFQAMGASVSDLYTRPEVRSKINQYIASHALANANDESYVNMNEPLRNCVSSKVPRLPTKAPGKAKGNETAQDPLDGEFLKRNDLYQRIMERMQAWHLITGGGREGVAKKGQLLPIRISIKLRQGRRASTLITGFEPFFVDADEMAEELRRKVASATSVSQTQAGVEVLVQGKQAQPVFDYLKSKGVPKKWIEAVDATGK